MCLFNIKILNYIRFNNYNIMKTLKKKKIQLTLQNFITTVKKFGKNLFYSVLYYFTVKLHITCSYYILCIITCNLH